MRTYEFRVRIYPDPATGATEDDPRVMFESVSDVVFEKFEGDVTPALIAGEVVLECEVRGRSMDKAVQQVINALSSVYGTPSAVDLSGSMFRRRSAPKSNPILRHVQVEAAGSQYMMA